MLRIWFINSFYFSEREYPNTEEGMNEAKAFVQSTTFEASIMLGDKVLCSYSYFGGWKYR